MEHYNFRLWRSMERSNYFCLCVDELMESKEYEQTRQAVRDLVRSIECICDPDNNNSINHEYPVIDIVQGIKDFLRMIPRNNRKKSMNHLLIFQCLNGTNALVSLFTSPIKGNKELAEESIRLFLINPISRTGFLLPKRVQNQCAMILLDFCNLLYQDDDEDDQQRLLYNSCHETLITILKSIACANRSTYFGFAEASSFLIIRLDRFLVTMSDKLDLCLSSLSGSSRSSFPRDVRAFLIVSLHMRRTIEEYVRSNMGQYSLPLCVDDLNFRKHPCYMFEIASYLDNFDIVGSQLKRCMMEWGKNALGIDTSVRKFNPMWSYYLSILKEMKYCSKLYQGANELLSDVIHPSWLMINYIIMHSKRSDEHLWILLERRNASNIEYERNLILTMMFPMVKNGEQKLHEITIDRSQLLKESFEQISYANPWLLGNGLSVVFKDELSTGPGVMVEWLFLVCKELFNPQNSLFLACPSDRRRFFPNPANMDDPRGLDYFRFCGRVCALAVKHKVRVGITLDRVFFLQLAGNKISLEDVRNADPYMYKSCKDILEMDADFIDSDALGLTFVNEIEEFGSRKIVELCAGGNAIAVNSKNREEYVNLLIQHCFVELIAEKVAYFAQGFGDILFKPRLQKFFFRSLELKDLDDLLLGNDKTISIKDWKAHTEYYDYKETDDQICWFWKVVESMSRDQQRELLFFWTSVKHLPAYGFSALRSPLYIYKTKSSHRRLPSSHTCFYRLGLPHYPSLDVMQQHLFLISQEHVGSGFGL